MTFHFVLLTPSGVAFEGDVSYCYIPTSNGPIGILPNHTPVIARISNAGGILYFGDKTGKRCFYVVKDGTATVKKDKTIVLVKFAKNVPSIEKGKEFLDI